MEERQLQSRSLTLDHRELLLLLRSFFLFCNLRALFHLEKKVFLLQLLKSVNRWMRFSKK